MVVSIIPFLSHSNILFAASNTLSLINCSSPAGRFDSQNDLSSIIEGWEKKLDCSVSKRNRLSESLLRTVTTEMKA